MKKNFIVTFLSIMLAVVVNAQPNSKLPQFIKWLDPSQVVLNTALKGDEKAKP